MLVLAALTLPMMTPSLSKKLIKREVVSRVVELNLMPRPTMPAAVLVLVMRADAVAV